MPKRIAPCVAVLVCALPLVSAAGGRRESKQPQQTQSKALDPIARMCKSVSNSITEACGFPIVVELDRSSFEGHESLAGPAGYFQMYAKQAFTTACTQDEKNASMKNKLKRILVVYDGSIPDDPQTKSNHGKLDLKNGTLTMRLNEHSDSIFEPTWHYIEATFK